MSGRIRVCWVLNLWSIFIFDINLFRLADFQSILDKQKICKNQHKFITAYRKSRPFCMKEKRILLDEKAEIVKSLDII
jgi:hypothetical protein